MRSQSRSHSTASQARYCSPLDRERRVSKQTIAVHYSSRTLEPLNGRVSWRSMAIAPEHFSRQVSAQQRHNSRHTMLLVTEAARCHRTWISVLIERLPIYTYIYVGGNRTEGFMGKTEGCGWKFQGWVDLSRGIFNFCFSLAWLDSNTRSLQCLRLGQRRGD